MEECNIPDPMELNNCETERDPRRPRSPALSDKSGEEGLGIVSTQAVYPDMAVVERRADSFLTYPYDAVKPPDDLIPAGYFYEGTSGMKALPPRQLCLRLRS